MDRHNDNNISANGVMIVIGVKRAEVVGVLMLLLMMTETVKFSTHAQVCTNDQVIRATSPHTASVRGPCHPHGTATAVGLRDNLGLRRRGRWWWWRWNWNTHTCIGNAGV